MTSPLDNLAGASGAIHRGLGPQIWRVLDKCHQIRNQGEYEGDLNIDEQLVRDLIVATSAVKSALDTLGELT
jgi:hypothetical protein